MERDNASKTGRNVADGIRRPPLRDDTRTMMMERKKQNLQAGFTLVEIMVVVVILGLLATMAAIGVPRYILDSKNTKAKGECRVLEDAIESFINMNNAHDVSPEEVLQLTVEDGRLKKKKVPKDPWGKDYIVTLEDNGQYTVHSMGDNGSDGDDDDVFSDGLRKNQESDY